MKRLLGSPRRAAALGASFFVSCTSLGCALPIEPDERVGEARALLTVAEAVTAGCSTSQIAGLSTQIIGQGNCIEPGAFSELSPTANANFGSAVLPFLEEPARDALAAALNENAGTSMQINSMLRTVAQQYLLYRWYQAGTCGIGLAASPGNSNHETGLAIDIQQYDTWRPILTAKGFTWLGSGDPVHFDYTGAGAVDNRDLGVLAFQQLWNLNHPEDLIDEDGSYGPQTEGRVELAPAEGFPEGPTCGTPTPGDPALSIAVAFADATDDFGDGPSADVVDLLEGESYRVVATVSNTGASEATGVTLSIDSDGDLVPDATTIDVGTVPALSSVDVEIAVDAASYSVTRVEPTAMTFSLDATTTTTLVADVYSQRRWEWDGERLEGWSAIGGGAPSLSGGALVVAAGDSVKSPPLDVDATSAPSLRISGSAAAPATLVVVTDSEENIFDVDLGSGSTVVNLRLSGRITSLRLDAPTGMSLDSVQLDTNLGPDDELPGATDDGGCSCRAAGAAPRFGGSLWLTLLVGLGLSRLAARRPSRAASDPRRPRNP